MDERWFVLLERRDAPYCHGEAQKDLEVMRQISAQSEKTWTRNTALEMMLYHEYLVAFEIVTANGKS